MLKNGFFNLAGSIVRLGLAVIMIPLLIHLIGVNEYGLWTLVNATLSMAALAEAGLSISVTYFLSADLAAQNNHAISETMSISLLAMLILATLVAGFLLVAADWIAGLFSQLSLQDRAAAAISIRVGSIVVWARLLQQVLFGPIQALQRYGLFSLIITAQAVVTNAVLVAIAYFGGRTVRMTMGLAGVTCLFLVIAAVAALWLLRGRNLRPLFSAAKFRSIGSYSALAWVSSLGNQLFSQGDRLIVGYFLGTAVLGVYGAITSIAAQVTSLTAMALNPLLPKMSSMWARGQREGTAYCPLLKQATALNAFVALGSGSFLFVVAPYLLPFVLPEASAEALIAFRLATAIYALYVLNATGYYLLFAVGQVRTNVVINLVSGVFALTLIAIGAMQYGLVGAVAGNAGYGLSLLFVYAGFRTVHVPLRAWLVWLALPLAWFVSVLGVNIVFAENRELAAVLYLLQTLLFGYWFCYTQRETLLPFARAMRLRAHLP
jgi:O-antigen/teichoic acid export membrane protein